MKKLLFSLCLMMMGASLYAQSLSRQVLASSGGHSSNSAGSVSSTVGELVINTGTSGSFLLTQGFQQPDANPVTGSVKGQQIRVDYELYPNPSRDVITLSLNATENINVNMYVYDAAGKLMQQPVTLQGAGNYKHNLYITAYSAGNYYVKIVNATGSDVKTIPFTKY